MSKIIGYGELMLRLTPISENSDKKNIVNYSSTFAGCEANSLIFLARRGHDCEFLSAFPKNELGLMAQSYLTSYNLKCNNNHEFESWFSNSEEYDKLNKKNLLECIYCSSKKITKSILKS